MGRAESCRPSFKTSFTGSAARRCEMLSITRERATSKLRLSTITVTFAYGFATMARALTETYCRKVRGPGTGAYPEFGSARNGLEGDWISGVKPGQAPKLN